jgi:hypothetical protein
VAFRSSLPNPPNLSRSVLLKQIDHMSSTERIIGSQIHTSTKKYMHRKKNGGVSGVLQKREWVSLYRMSSKGNHSVVDGSLLVPRNELDAICNICKNAAPISSLAATENRSKLPARILESN